jgi:hypothetical protein
MDVRIGRAPGKVVSGTSDQHANSEDIPIVAFRMQEMCLFDCGSWIAVLCKPASTRRTTCGGFFIVPAEPP